MVKKSLLILTLISLLFISTQIKSAKQTWADWKEVTYIPLEFGDINILIGDGPFTNWYSEGRMDAGKKAHQYWIENYTNKGFIIIEYLAMPAAWHISNSGNDKKYIIQKGEYLLNTENNPLERIKKRDIERYRDIYNNVVAYVYFDHEGSSCVIFKKGYFKNQSGYVPSTHDSETLVGIYCTEYGTIDEIIAHEFIDAVQVKN